MKRLVPILLCLFLLHVPGARAAGMDAVEGLETARRAFAGINDFVAEVTQEKQISLLRKKLVSTGTVRFKRPDAFLMKIDPPHESRMLLKGNAITLVFPDENVRQQTALPAGEGLLHWITLLEKPVTKVPPGLDVRAERGSDSVTLVLKPAGKRGVREIQLTMTEDGRPKRVVIEEQNRDRTVMTFRKVRKNIGLTDKEFTLD